MKECARAFETTRYIRLWAFFCMFVCISGVLNFQFSFLSSKALIKYLLIYRGRITEICSFINDSMCVYRAARVSVVFSQDAAAYEPRITTVSLNRSNKLLWKSRNLSTANRETAKVEDRLNLRQSRTQTAGFVRRMRPQDHTYTYTRPENIISRYWERFSTKNETWILLKTENFRAG